MSTETPIENENLDTLDRPVKEVKHRRPNVRKRRRITAGARGRFLFYSVPVLVFVLVITVFIVKIASIQQVEVPLMDQSDLEAQGGLIDRDHPIPLEANEPGDTEPEIVIVDATEPTVPMEEPTELSETDPDPVEAEDPEIEVFEKLYVVSVPALIYAEPSPSSEVILEPQLNDIVLKTGASGEWTEVKSKRGETGYIKTALVAGSPFFLPQIGETYYVQNRQVYVRSGPGTNYEIEGFALRGMTVRVLELADGWSKIRTEHGLNGFMHNDLFGPGKPENEISELEVGRYMYVDTEEANLRESPSTDAEIIGAAFMDDRVYQISDNGGWSKIRTEGGVVAYVFNHLLREKAPANPFVRTNRTLYIDTNSVNVRSSPTTDASVVKRLDRDQSVTELEANDTWSKVKLSDGSVGFIRSDLLTNVTPPPEGFQRASGTLYVTTGAANIRSQPNTSSSVVVVTRYGESLTRVATGASWTMIKTSAGKSGYISNDLISTKKPAAQTGGGGSGSGSSSSGSGSSGNANSTLRQRVVDIARSAVGTPYRLGGKTMSAFDCSGLVKYTFEAIGYKNIPHGSDPQARQLGTKISFSGRDFSNLLPGDLIFFSRGYGYHHVGIYIGNNQMVHAVSGRGTVIDNLMTYPLAARVNRVLD